MVWYPGKNVISLGRRIGSNIMDRRRDSQGVRDRAMGAPGSAPQIAGAQAAYELDRAAQGQALGAYGQAVSGNAPSVAEAQARAGAAQSVVNQLGLTAMGSGGSLAAQQRQAAGMGAAGSMAANRDAAMLRASEIDAARAGLANQANAMAGMSAAQLGQNADLTAQWDLGQRELNLQAQQQRKQNQLGWANQAIGAFGGLAQAGIFSDENLKKDMRPADEDAADALAKLRPVGYRYKSERHGPTDVETIGITAQDLAKSKLGKRLVREVEGEGLAVDVPGSVSLLLAGTAGIEKRLRKLEGRK